MRTLPWYTGFYAALVLFCGGCSLERMKVISPDAPLPLNSESGVVVGSITAVTAEHYWEIGAVTYERADGSVSGWIESASRTTNAFWFKHSMTPGYPGPDAGLEREIGRVFAIVLPAGRYALYPSGTHNYEPFIAIAPAAFEVLPRQVIYIGRIQLRGCIYTPSNKRAWRAYINASVPAIEDHWDTDRELLLRKYPALNEHAVVLSLIDDQVWEGLEVSLESKLETRCRSE